MSYTFKIGTDLIGNLSFDTISVAQDYIDDNEITDDLIRIETIYGYIFVDYFDIDIVENVT